MTERQTERRLTKTQLLQELERCAKDLDTEAAHCEADGLLLTYINDKEIDAGRGRYCAGSFDYCTKHECIAARNVIRKAKGHGR